MVGERWERLAELFSAALARPAGERAAWLREACGPDAALRSEIESLLAAHEAEAGALDRLRAALLAPDEQPEAAGAAPAAGARLGPWRLGPLLGRGGAGEVYLAERDDGTFAQRAAVKLLRPEAAEELERFHAERRLLARLEHPGIARLLDGGVGPDGRPYAALEYVEGANVVAHCGEHALDLPARLALFAQICEVVEYAHANLVVHRDLKPGNILVGRDGRVKLLDFGIAKLLDAGMPGDQTRAPFTPDYAAPEQLTGEPVTTATDVWSLGVVLFELLVGERPFRGGALAGTLQRVVENAAPVPSAAARARAARGEPVPVPPRLLLGDLDAVVGKCLRHRPADRYASVAALAQDLERHLRDEPVEARERRRRYVVGRLVRRHRWAIAAGAAVATALAVGLVAFAVAARRAAIERDAARRAASREEALRYALVNLFRESLQPAPGGAAAVTAKAMLDRSAARVLDQYQDDPVLAGSVVETLADLYGALQDIEGQVPLLETFLARAGAHADPRAVAVARQKLAQLELARGHVDRAGELLAGAQAFWQTDPARWVEPRLEASFVQGLVLRTRGDVAGSIAAYEAAIPERIRVSGRDHRETANLYNSLAISLTAAGRNEDALAAYRESLAIHERLGRGDELDALILRGNTGTLAYRTGRIRDAEAILRRAYTGQRAAAGDSAAVAAAMGLWGAAATVLGRAPEALPALRDAAALAERFSGPVSPLTVQNRVFLADALAATAARAEARELLRSTLEPTRAQYGETHLLTLRIRLALARLELDEGRPAAAQKAVEALLPGFAAAGAQGKLWAAHAQLVRGDALLAAGRPEAAAGALAEAVRLREAVLWSGSADLAQARARLGEARLAGGDAGGRSLVEGALPALRAELGPEHPETRRAERALAAKRGERAS